MASPDLPSPFAPLELWPHSSHGCALLCHLWATQLLSQPLEFPLPHASPGNPTQLAVQNWGQGPLSQDVSPLLLPAAGWVPGSWVPGLPYLLSLLHPVAKTAGQEPH